MTNDMTYQEHIEAICDGFKQEEARIAELPESERKQEARKWLTAVGILNPDGTRTELYADW